MKLRSLSNINAHTGPEIFGEVLRYWRRANNLLNIKDIGYELVRCRSIGGWLKIPSILKIMDMMEHSRYIICIFGVRQLLARNCL